MSLLVHILTGTCDTYMSRVLNMSRISYLYMSLLVHYVLDKVQAQSRWYNQGVKIYVKFNDCKLASMGFPYLPARDHHIQLRYQRKYQRKYQRFYKNRTKGFTEVPKSGYQRKYQRFYKKLYHRKYQRHYQRQT